MTNPTTFEQVNHPLIIVSQAVAAVALIRLFFAIRRTPAPVPQLVALTGFAFLANLVGRVMKEDWFFVSDIVEYALLAAVVVAAVMAVLHERQKEARRPGAKVIIADFFDRWQTRVTWLVGLFVAGIVITDYAQAYLGQKQAVESVKVAVTQENTRVTAEFAREQQEAKEVRDTIVAGLQNIATGLASVSATQETLLAGVGIADASPTPTRRKSPPHSRVKLSAEVEPVRRKDDAVEINRTVVAPPTSPPAPKKSFWKRLFGRAGTDSLQTVRSDTLANYE